MCKVQDDLDQGFINFPEILVASSVYQVSVWWREMCTEDSQVLGATVQNKATWVALSWSLTGAHRNVGK